MFAFVDGVKPATVDLTCTNKSDERVIYIVSNVSQSRLMVNAQIAFEGRQLVAGTEGGPVYMQIVGGGYNVTIQGGDFDTAFENSSTILNAKASALIWSKDSNESVEGVSRQIKPLLKVLVFTRHQHEFAASAVNSKFSW